MSFRKKFQRTMGFVVGAMMTVGGIYILWLPLNGIYVRTFVLTEQTQAEITAKEESESPQRLILHYQFFTTDGQTVTGQAEVSWDQFEHAQIGGEDRVTFDPSAPETHRLRHDGPFSPKLLFMFFVLPIVASGTRSMRASWRGVPSEKIRSRFAVVRFFDAGGIGSVFALGMGG